MVLASYVIMIADCLHRTMMVLCYVTVMVRRLLRQNDYNVLLSHDDVSSFDTS